jgi:glycerophosphoryl diester phosphodiesterase
VRRIVTLLRTREEQRLSSRVSGIAQGRNVILLSAESLQAFVLGLSIGGRPIAPNFTAFAKESLQFNYFYDQTHRGTTADAEFVSLNSLMPLQFGAVATRYASHDSRALPEVLMEHGYRTLSACAEPPAFWNMGDRHPKLGFQRSLFEFAFPGARWVGAGLDDVHFFDAMSRVLQREPEPFFAYLISSSNHHPYRLPPDHQRLARESLPSGMAGDYLQSVKYFDDAFGAFVSNLAESGLLDSTMIAVFGDHQSWLDDANLQRIWRASGRDKDPTPLELWKFRRQVPFLIRLPNAAESGARETPGGHLDVAPTLLSLLGIAETGPWLGRDLTSPARNVVVFRDGSVTDEAVSLIVNHERRERACYTRTSETIPCGRVEPLAAEGRTVLEASDAIIQGNLVDAVAADLRGRPGKSPRAPGRVLVIAHRGDSIHYPENTAASIRAAFDLGADAVEVDVRLSRDGVPMIFHDDTLERTTNGRGPFERLSLQELQSLDAGSWFDKRFAGARILTLEEALRIAHGRGSLLLDLKVDGLTGLVRSAFERVGATPEAAIIAAWPPSEWPTFVRQMPGARVLNTNDAPLIWDASLFAETRRQGIWGFELGDYWPAPFLGDAAVHETPVIAYTVNDEPTLRRLVEAGIAGIETDDPALLLRVAARLHAR